ncbi:MAG: MarP family serine protease [Nocardioides sp.]|jgi:S1-C subfamily serine protease
MNVLDWCLLVLVGLYALSGYWQGFITGASATAGLLIGGVLGIWLAPLALGNAASSVWVSLGALFIVILCASLGQALMQYVGAHLRDRIAWQPVRFVDAVGGAALSAVAVLLVSWALGVAVSGSRLGALTPQVRESIVLGKVDAALPNGANRVLRAFDNVVGNTFFPRYLEPFAPERIVKVAPGPKRMFTDPDVVNAAPSVLKVRSTRACQGGIEGSGFLYARNRLMTNAHVVAGVRRPEVLIGDRSVPARVVHYDARLDVAVLALDTANLPTLPFNRSAKAKDPIAILGFPQDGPYDVRSGRIRAQQRLRSPDIYGSGSVIREVFSVRGLVRPGNSGGPIVDSAGDVVGVVFAASVSDRQTGYALTADQVAEAAALGVTSSAQVSTGRCVS